MVVFIHKKRKYCLWDCTELEEEETAFESQLNEEKADKKADRDI